MTILNKVIQDRTGVYHKIGEEIIIIGEPFKRSNFDDRLVVKIKYSNGISDTLFLDEIGAKNE
jgi:hypothetical protein